MDTPPLEIVTNAGPETPAGTESSTDAEPPVVRALVSMLPRLVENATSDPFGTGTPFRFDTKAETSALPHPDGLIDADGVIRIPISEGVADGAGVAVAIGEGEAIEVFVGTGEFVAIGVVTVGVVVVGVVTTGLGV